MYKRIKEIRPNPLLTSTVEIRFSSDLNASEVLSKFYKLFGEEYPKIIDRGFPKNLKEIDPELKYNADFILSNESFSVSIGNNVIAFENIGEYKLWTNYLVIIKKGLDTLNKMGIVKQIQRVGVRYASIFDNSPGIENMINAKLNLNYSGYNQGEEFFKATFKKDDVNLLLQIIQNATVTRNTDIKKGLYIDIDCSQNANLPQNIGDELLSIVNLLHQEEKRLFEFLLKQSYLDTLDIIYE